MGPLLCVRSIIFNNLFRNFVPISLLLTLEIVKLFQAIFISWDHSMFDTNQGIEAGV
jgi:magnesium-transporting ATPase (P-type)